MRVKFTPSARARFLEGLEFVRQDSPFAALRFREKSEQVLRRLEKSPDSGRSAQGFPALPHREVIVRSFRFFFRVSGGTVWIVAVWHDAQLPAGPGN